MICYIYRSNKRAEMYLYTLRRDDFTDLPDTLLNVFGKPEFSMMLNLGKRTSLARVDIIKVQQELSGNGYYLQMPPVILDDQNKLTPTDEHIDGR